MARLQALERSGKHPPKKTKVGGEGLDRLLVFSAHERKVSLPLDIESCQEKIT